MSDLIRAEKVRGCERAGSIQWVWTRWRPGLRRGARPSRANSIDSARFSTNLTRRLTCPASAALVTVHLAQSEDGTTLTYTEQGVILDGTHSLTIAEQGTGVLLQRLGEELARWEVGLWPCSESTR